MKYVKQISEFSKENNEFLSDLDFCLTSLTGPFFLGVREEMNAFFLRDLVTLLEAPKSHH